jgi:hypothetical protein
VTATPILFEPTSRPMTRLRLAIRGASIAQL